MLQGSLISPSTSCKIGLGPAILSIVKSGLNHCVLFITITVLSSLCQVAHCYVIGQNYNLKFVNPVAHAVLRILFFLSVQVKMFSLFFSTRLSQFQITCTHSYVISWGLLCGIRAASCIVSSFLFEFRTKTVCRF